MTRSSASDSQRCRAEGTWVEGKSARMSPSEVTVSFCSSSDEQSPLGKGCSVRVAQSRSALAFPRTPGPRLQIAELIL